MRKFALNSIKSSLIVILLFSILLEVSGNGIFSVIECSGDFSFKRCIKIDNDNPDVLMSDFYDALKKSDRDVNLAWNMLSKEIQNNYENIKGGVKGKNYFFNFWGDEVDSFVILKKTIIKRKKVLTDIEYNICYKRNHEYAKAHKMPNRFCSKDLYRVIRKKEDRAGSYPYLWSMDTFTPFVCSKAEIKVCNEHSF